MSGPMERNQSSFSAQRFRNLRVPTGNISELFSCRPSEIVDRLTKRGVNHIYVDGGVTIQGFLKEGLIQRMTITRIPVLLGTGIPLFGPLPHDIHFSAHVD